MITEGVRMDMELDVPENPFPGLRPFEFHESLLYFGRDGQSERMLAKLAKHRFVAVVGTSGSGKSSLVRAGLLPALFGGFMTSAGSDWRVAIMRPGNDPLGNLARALNAPGVFGSEIAENAALQTAITEATLRRGSLGLVEAVRQVRMPPGDSLLIVADQFEELFRFAHASGSEKYQNEAAAFVKLLLEAINQRDVPVYVVLTLRSDYLGDCSLFWGLPEAINESQYLIPRLTREQRKEAITGPVAVCGGDITPRLVNLLLNDMGDNPDQLPILQHALMRTWNRWKETRADGEPMDIRHYHEIGTMASALSLHAEEAFADLPDDRSRALAEKLFKGLTEKGPDNREIRRPVTLRELCELADAREDEVVAVVDVFRQPGRSFLVPPAGVALRPDSLVDISHESLIRNWQRLRKWVDEEARSARIYQRLAETAALHEKGEAGFWGDPDLQLALNWREQTRPNEVWAARYHPNFGGAIAFLEASRAKRDWEIAEKEAARRAELRRTRGFLIILFVAFLFSLGSTVFAFRSRAEALRQSAIAQQKSREALTQKERADQEARNARESQQHALEQKGEAERQAEIALTNEQKAKEAQGQAVEQARIAHANELKAISANRVAEEQRARAEEQRQLAEHQTEVVRQREKEARAARAETVQQWQTSLNLLYAADLNLAQQAYTEENVPRAQELLEAAGEPVHFSTEEGVYTLDRRGFEWYYLWQLYHKDRATIAGHTDPVTSIAFSPDGRVLATASYDQTVKLWDTSTQEKLATLAARAEVLAVAFSPDGKTVATGGKDNAVRLWDAKTGQELAALRHDGAVETVAFSPDGRLVASGGDDKAVRLWDAATRREVAAFPDGGELRSVAFSPDGRLLAAGGLDNDVKLWDVATRQKLATLKGHTEPVWSVAFSPDGRRLASGSDDKMVRVWDVEARRELMAFNAHSAPIHSVAFSTDGRTLAVAGADISGEGLDNTVRLWDVSNPKGQKELGPPLAGHKEAVTAVAFSPDGKSVATASFDRTAKLWDAASLRGLTTLKGHEKSVLAVAFSPDGRRVATASLDNSAKVWDASTRRELTTLAGHKDAVTSVAFSPDGKLVATGSRDASVKLWDAANYRELSTLRGHGDKSVLSVAFSPDGRVLASGGNDNRVKLWDARTGRELAALEGHDNSVTSVAFSPDGRVIATASFDKTVKLWDASTHALLRTLKGPDGPLWSVAFSPDGKTVAGGSSRDKTVTLWDAEAGTVIDTLKCNGEVLSVAFSPDGMTIAAGSSKTEGGGENVVNLWGAQSRQELLKLGFEEPVSSVAFSPDSRVLATGSFQPVVKLWYAATPADARARHE